MRKEDKWNREGDDSPLPSHGFMRIVHVLVTHVGNLLFANILTAIFSIPIVTIPAALTGLHAVVQQCYRKGYGDTVWTKFWGEFKSAFGERLAASAVLVGLPVAGWLLGSLLGEIYSYCFCAFLLVLVVIVAGWWFPQMAILKLSPSQAMRNAFLMVMIATKENLLLVLMYGLTAMACLLLWPVSVVPLAVFIPALLALLNADVVNPVLEEQIIKPSADAALSQSGQEDETEE